MFPTIDRQRTGERIRKIMKQQNITVKQIQEYLNLSCVQGIYHWLDGASMPTIDNLYALSELFEVPMDYLVCGNRKYKGTRNISEKMLVTQALDERDLLVKKIADKINKASFVDTIKPNEDKVYSKGDLRISLNLGPFLDHESYV